MNWKKLKSFKSIAEYKSLNQAAKSLDNSQSNLSRIVKTLETSCGQELFLRHAKGIHLTDSGKKLLKIVNQFNDETNIFSKLNT